AFDVFGTLVKIGERRSPYRKLMKWLKENGRQPQPDDAKFIMSHNLNLAELAKRLAVNIPDQFLQELEHHLDKELRSITLYEDTLSTLEELKKLGIKLALCSNLAMPYGKLFLHYYRPLMLMPGAMQLLQLNLSRKSINHSLTN